VSAQAVYEGVSEGALLASYQFRGSKTDEAPKRVQTAHFFAPKTYEPQARRGEIIAQGTMLARNLVNSPANFMTPKDLANAARKMARETGLRCEVFDRPRIEKEKMGLLLGVAQGSEEDPRFVVLEYGKPRKGQGPLVFVGKGVTFDSGGISIKPATNMEQMKYDMSGAAAVVGAMHNVAKLKPAAHVIGIFAATENMPSGKATKPGDVHIGRSGKSVEIINTDAEGRLILADALDYAKTFKPSAVVNAATLTGACVIALGHAIGVMGNNADLLAAVKSAAEHVGERAWELPMFDEYGDSLKSEVADLKNVSGGRGAGTITAAKFLEKFTDYPWVHLDVAGAAWEDKDHPYRPKGGTGVAVRTFTQLAETWFR
jgi:leucyl aminopeptidase